MLREEMIMKGLRKFALGLVYMIGCFGCVIAAVLNGDAALVGSVAAAGGIACAGC